MRLDNVHTVFARHAAFRGRTAKGELPICKHRLRPDALFAQVLVSAQLVRMEVVDSGLVSGSVRRSNRMLDKQSLGLRRAASFDQ